MYGFIYLFIYFFASSLESFDCGAKNVPLDVMVNLGEFYTTNTNNIHDNFISLEGSY